MKLCKSIALLGLVAFASGCTTGANDVVRPEALTLGAGNAQAANTVMQMVDPWPPGVNNSNIKSPADLSQHKPEDNDEVEAVTTSDVES